MDIDYVEAGTLNKRIWNKYIETSGVCEYIKGYEVLYSDSVDGNYIVYIIRMPYNK